MTMKIKDPYYSYDKRVNGMISLSFKHAEKSKIQSDGNMKGERLTDRPPRKKISYKLLSLKLRITDSIKRKGEPPKKIKYIVNGDQTPIRDIITNFQTSASMLSNLASQYDTIFIGEDRIDFEGYNTEGGYIIYHNGEILKENLYPSEVADFLGITVKNTYNRAFIKNTDRNGYKVVNQRRMK